MGVASWLAQVLACMCMTGGSCIKTWWRRTCKQKSKEGTATNQTLVPGLGILGQGWPLLQDNLYLKANITCVPLCRATSHMCSCQGAMCLGTTSGSGGTAGTRSSTYATYGVSQEVVNLGLRASLALEAAREEAQEEGRRSIVDAPSSSAHCCLAAASPAGFLAWNLW